MQEYIISLENKEGKIHNLIKVSLNKEEGKEGTNRLLTNVLKRISQSGVKDEQKIHFKSLDDFINEVEDETFDETKINDAISIDLSDINLKEESEKFKEELKKNIFTHLLSNTDNNENNKNNEEEQGSSERIEEIKELERTEDLKISESLENSEILQSQQEQNNQNFLTQPQGMSNKIQDISSGVETALTGVTMGATKAASNAISKLSNFLGIKNLEMEGNTTKEKSEAFTSPTNYFEAMDEITKSLVSNTSSALKVISEIGEGNKSRANKKRLNNSIKNVSQELKNLGNLTKSISSKNKDNPRLNEELNKTWKDTEEKMDVFSSKINAFSKENEGIIEDEVLKNLNNLITALKKVVTDMKDSVVKFFKKKMGIEVSEDEVKSSSKEENINAHVQQKQNEQLNQLDQSNQQNINPKM